MSSGTDLSREEILMLLERHTSKLQEMCGSPRGWKLSNYVEKAQRIKELTDLLANLRVSETLSSRIV